MTTTTITTTESWKSTVENWKSALDLGVSPVNSGSSIGSDEWLVGFSPGGRAIIQRRRPDPRESLLTSGPLPQAPSRSNSDSSLAVVASYTRLPRDSPKHLVNDIIGAINSIKTETKEAIKDQITELRDQILKPMATKIHELETRIAGMERKTTNYVNKDAHTHTQKQMDSLEVKIKTIENDLKKLKDDSNSPSSTVDRGNNFYNTVINQTAKINNLVIAGLKEPTEHAEDESEEPEDIKAQVMTLAASLKCSISSNFQVHRLGSKRKSARPVLVEFANQWDRRKLFVASRGTAIKDAGLKNIFVNEDLDKKQAALYFLTRQAKKLNLIKSTWTFGGIVNISVAGETVQLDSEQHLRQLVPSLPQFPRNKPSGNKPTDK